MLNDFEIRQFQNTYICLKTFEKYMKMYRSCKINEHLIAVLIFFFKYYSFYWNVYCFLMLKLSESHWSPFVLYNRVY